MVQLTRIYTKSGDKGKTSLGDGSRIFKTNPRINVIGSVDEANASLGIVRAHCGKEHEQISDLLNHCQNDLFDLGADLCMPEGGGLQITADQVLFLEKTMDEFNEVLEPLHSFVLPGGSVLSSFLHHARTTVRRAERDVCHLMEHVDEFDINSLNPEILKYLNRLSDLLFILGRFVNDKGKGDILWVPGKNRAK